MERRPTAAFIDTGALRHNYSILRERMAGGVRIMAVVKANAYGHGDVEVARVLEGIGCRHFGVAILEEGARLRRSGIKGSIVILGGIYPGQVPDIFSLDLTPVVFDIESARVINAAAASLGTIRKVHVKIDTGMGRLGVAVAEALSFFEEINRLRHIHVEGVLSHFAESESEDRSFTQRQIKEFSGVIEMIRGMGFSPEIIDIANSAAALDHPASHLGMVRPGLMLYGSYPSPRLREAVDLKPVMELKTRIMYVKRVGAGYPVSYGRTFVTKKESVIATLPIGYADGLPRRLSGTGEVLVGGVRAPLAGRVCMDLVMCDVTGVPGVKTGDEVVIIGAQGLERITVEEVAQKAGTISYEVLCNISSRVPRVYI